MISEKACFSPPQIDGLLLVDAQRPKASPIKIVVLAAASPGSCMDSVGWYASERRRSAVNVQMFRCAVEHAQSSLEPHFKQQRSSFHSLGTYPGRKSLIRTCTVAAEPFSFSSAVVSGDSM